MGLIMYKAQNNLCLRLFVIREIQHELRARVRQHIKRLRGKVMKQSIIQS